MRIGWEAALATMLVVPAWSSTLYSTGPTYDGIDSGAFGIFGDNEVTDSFVISSSSEVTGVSNIGITVQGPDTPQTLNWVISTLPDGGGTVEGSGSDVSLSSSFFEDGPVPPFVYYYSSFSISGLTLAAGTYYLELSDATTQNSERVLWSTSSSLESTGPSTADQNGWGAIASESFEIDGTVLTAATPEPSNAALSVVGLAVLAGVAWLRRRSSI